MTEARIIVALDYADADAARQCVARLNGGADESQAKLENHAKQLCKLKVGKELFVAAGPVFVQELVAQGYDVFLDLKFHDIPNTVAQACKAAARLGVWMMNVHASGGPRMMLAAREALESLPAQQRRPLLIAVTVLTSMGADELNAIGIATDAAQQVTRLARLTHAAGLDGVVCSAQEARVLRQTLGPDFCLVTPGIRPAGSAAGDQTRILTPQQALQAGADYLVIGRPITQAADPLAALIAIAQEIAVV